jgi:Outer membrane protein beta-barrel domain
MIRILATLLVLFSTSLFATEGEVPLDGKVDIGLTYIHVDVLRSGKTDHTMDLAGVKAELNYRIWKCLLLRPSINYGHGRHKNELVNGGLALGVYLPLCEGLIVTPLAGIHFGYLKTTLKVQHPQFPIIQLHLDEKFHSSSPFIGFEISYTFVPTWRVVGNIQYGWSHTRTTIKPLVKDWGHSEGFFYGAMIEHDLDDHWSLNLGGAYNNSLSKEKNGLRGFKLGIAYWF